MERITGAERYFANRLNDDPEYRQAFEEARELMAQLNSLTDTSESGSLSLVDQATQEAIREAKEEL